MEATRPTLISRIRAGDDDAWSDFYRMYSGPLFAYCKKFRLSDEDAHDVLQETMMLLFTEKIQDFRYDPEKINPKTGRKQKFRNWLLTFVHRKAMRLSSHRYKEAVRRAAADDYGDLDEKEWLENLADEAQVHPAEELDREHDECERNWERALEEEALRRIREDESIDRRTMEIYDDYVLQGMKAAEVAAKYDMNANAIYQIKNRVSRKLRDLKDALSVDMEPGEIEVGE